MSKNYLNIPAFPEYGISIDGSVCHLNSNTILDWIMQGNIPHVLINENLYPIPAILAHTYIGPCALHVITTAKDIWYRSRYISYGYSKIALISDDEIMLDDVRFKRIPICNQFYISEHGVVFNLLKERFVHRTFTDNHYGCVKLKDKYGNERKHMIHVLVYMTYYGPIPPGHVIDHKDNTTYNNFYLNLQCITQEENIHRSYSQGRNQHRLVWTVDQIKDMCGMMEAGLTVKEIASAMQIDYNEGLMNLLTRIRTGISYKEIASNYNFEKYDTNANRCQLSPSQKLEAIEMAKNEIPLDEVARHFGCDKQTLTRLVRNTDVSFTKKKFTHAQVDTIRQEYENGMSISALAKKYGSKNATIKRMIDGNYFEVRGRDFRIHGTRDDYRKLSDSDIREIKRLLSDGKLSQMKIAKQFGVTDSLISNINTGKRYANI